MAIYKGHNEDSSGNILLSIGNGMTATVETGSTASQAYTKGSYIFFNNRFCKATSAIASGVTLAIGTNLSETSVGAELTSHLRSSDGKEFYFDVKDGTYGYYPSASKTASEFVPFGGTTDINITTLTTAGQWEGTGTSFSYTIPSSGKMYVIGTISYVDQRGAGMNCLTSDVTVKTLINAWGNHMTTVMLLVEGTPGKSVSFNIYVSSSALIIVGHGYCPA